MSKGPRSQRCDKHLGGIADVLEEKARRGPLEHLGDLASFGLYANDSQIEEVRYRWSSNDVCSYQVRLWVLGDGAVQSDPSHGGS